MICQSSLQKNKKPGMQTVYSALFITLLFSFQAQATDMARPIWVLLVGEDFALFPFAQYANNKWSFPWSTPKTFDSTRPPSLIIPKELIYYPLNGDKQIVQLTKPTIVSTLCQFNWAYETNITTSVIDRTTKEVRNFLGLAVSKNINTQQEVEVIDEQYRQITALLYPKIESCEREHIKKRNEATKNKIQALKQSVTNEISEASIDESQFEFEIFTTMALDESCQVYRFEVQKKYASFSAEENCPSTFHCNGWCIVSGKTLKKVVDVELSIDNCDQDLSPEINSLGYIELNGAILWIGQKIYVDSEYYEMYKITPQSLERIIRLLGGKC